MVYYNTWYHYSNNNKFSEYKCKYIKVSDISPDMEYFQEIQDSFLKCYKINDIEIINNDFDFRTYINYDFILLFKRNDKCVGYAYHSLVKTFDAVTGNIFLHPTNADYEDMYELLKAVDVYHVYAYPLINYNFNYRYYDIADPHFITVMRQFYKDSEKLKDIIEYIPVRNYYNLVYFKIPGNYWEDFENRGYSMEIIDDNLVDLSYKKYLIDLYNLKSNLYNHDIISYNDYYNINDIILKFGTTTFEIPNEGLYTIDLNDFNKEISFRIYSEKLSKVLIEAAINQVIQLQKDYDNYKYLEFDLDINLEEYLNNKYNNMFIVYKLPNNIYKYYHEFK